MITIDLNSATPIGDQILGEIRRLIALGSLMPGQELPPVRQLAADLGINLNTVARAYRSLETDGLVSTARGRGTRITSSREQSRGSRSVAVQRVRDALGHALADAKLAGLSESQTREMVDRLFAQYWTVATEHNEG